MSKDTYQPVHMPSPQQMSVGPCLWEQMHIVPTISLSVFLRWRKIDENFLLYFVLSIFWIDNVILYIAISTVTFSMIHRVLNRQNLCIIFKACLTSYYHLIFKLNINLNQCFQGLSLHVFLPTSISSPLHPFFPPLGLSRCFCINPIS